MHNCTCTVTGLLNVPKAANTNIHAISTIRGDSGLCTFEWGYCPSLMCVSDEDSLAPACADDGTDPRPECAEVDVCDFTKSYLTLDDLEAALNKIELVCVDFYTLDRLGTTLNQMLNNCKHITSSYDSKFDDYIKYVKEVINSQLETL